MKSCIGFYAIACYRDGALLFYAECQCLQNIGAWTWDWHLTWNVKTVSAYSTVRCFVWRRHVMSFSKLGFLPSSLTLVFCFFYTEHSPQHFTHTHLLTVSNTVGSVSSLVWLTAKPRLLSSTVLSSAFSRFHRSSLVHNRELSFFHFIPCWDWVKAGHSPGQVAKFITGLI